MKTDVYQIVTDRIIQLLETGTVPWHQPWQVLKPQNMVSRKPYRGINAFLLNTARYTSPFWLTFRQAQALGGTVKKGEHAFPVVFWKVIEDKEEQDDPKRIPFLRYYNVFNATQCEGIPAPQVEPVHSFEPIALCELVLTEIPRRPGIQHGGSRACYSPLQDEITLPEAGCFESAEDYYSTLFHELTHSTGHASRLNRKEVTEPNRFGSDPYSREELVAEMGAAFLCGHCGIEHRTVDQSAGYVSHWLARLKDDRKLVIHAASQAQKACDFILDAPPHAGEETPVEPQPEPMVMRDAPPPVRSLKIEAHGDFAKGRIKPKIRLTGKWLERAGFSPGSRVQVTCAAPGIMELRSDIHPF
jgi:antirestriction protein ArdC